MKKHYVGTLFGPKDGYGSNQEEHNTLFLIAKERGEEKTEVNRISRPLNYVYKRVNGNILRRRRSL